MGERNDDGKLIIDALRKSYKKRMSKSNNYISLPNNVNFYFIESKINIHINKNSVCKNMQHNESAFESWALVFMNWLEEIDEVSLEWEKPDNINNGHYQRFLYRVLKFEELFYNWFSVGMDLCQYLRHKKSNFL